MMFKTILASVALIGAASTADAALIQVKFQGTTSASGGVSNSVFGQVTSVTGSFIYDSNAAGVRFTDFAYNHPTAVKSLQFTLQTTTGPGVSGNLGAARTGNVQLGNFRGSDSFQVANLALSASELFGEASYVTGAQVNVRFAGPNTLWNAPTPLPSVFDPALFTGQKQFTIFASTTQGRPAGTAVSINFNFNSVEAAVVPVPAALPLLATALAGLGFTGWRRSRTRR